MIEAMRSTLLAKGTDTTKRRLVRAALDGVVTYMRDHFAVEENPDEGVGLSRI
jgi:hemerythrin